MAHTRKLLILKGLKFILPCEFPRKNAQHVAKSLILKDLASRPPPVMGKRCGFAVSDRDYTDASSRPAAMYGTSKSAKRRIAM